MYEISTHVKPSLLKKWKQVALSFRVIDAEPEANALLEVIVAQIAGSIPDASDSGPELIQTGSPGDLLQKC